jgi:hypothetical protein
LAYYPAQDKPVGDISTNRPQHGDVIYLMGGTYTSQNTFGKFLRMFYVLKMSIQVVLIIDLLKNCVMFLFRKTARQSSQSARGKK